jgi:hypothetical protein
VDDGDQDDTELEAFLESKSELEVASDIPLAYQVYDMVRASGTQGITSNVSCDAMQCLGVSPVPNPYLWNCSKFMPIYHTSV